MEHRFRRGDLTFDVLDAGPADGPVVVLLHGFPEINQSWQPLIDSLVAHGYRCLAPNQRGYSPGARPKRRRDYRDSELVADVVALIDASGASRVHLVGHDWGATVAWYVAQRHPDRLASLTTMSVPHPGAFLASMVRSRQGLASWYIYFFQLPRIPERYFLSRRGGFTARGIRPTRAPEATASFDSAMTALSDPGAMTAALNWYRGIPFSDTRRANDKVTVPTLFIWGDDDVALRRVGAENTEKYVTAEYRFEPLVGVDHWILDRRPELVSQLVIDWVAKHPAR